MIKKKKIKFDPDAYRFKLLCAVDAMDPTREVRLDEIRGGVEEVNGDCTYPTELIYYRDIVALIDKRNYFSQMSCDAKDIISFVCLSEIGEVKRLCGSPTTGKITARRVAKHFRMMWGRLRVKKAMREIRNLLLI